MTSRTSQSTVTFDHQFKLYPLEGLQPAGTYRVIAVDDEIPGLSFVAYRRTETTLQVPALTSKTNRTQMFPIDKEELEAALKADEQVQPSNQT